MGSGQTTPGKETSVAHELTGPDVKPAAEPTPNETQAVDVQMLLRLPIELRFMIYRHLLLALEPISLELINPFRAMPIWYEGRQVYSSMPLDTALLLVNTQIHAEAAVVLYSENTFRICYTSEVGLMSIGGREKVGVMIPGAAGQKLGNISSSSYYTAASGCVRTRLSSFDASRLLAVAANSVPAHRLVWALADGASFTQ